MSKKTMFMPRKTSEEQELEVCDLAVDDDVHLGIRNVSEDRDLNEDQSVWYKYA